MTFWELYLGIGAVGGVIVGLYLTTKKDSTISFDEQAKVPPAMQMLGVTVVTAISMAIWPLAFAVVATMIWEKISALRIRDEPKKKTFKVGHQDLIEALSIEEIERREKVFDPLDAVPAAPFGFLNPEWMAFRTKIKSDDVVWSFSSSWTRFATQKRIQGYALARGQDVGDFFISSAKLESPPE